MDKDVQELYNIAMRQLLDNTKHKKFFTQEEFEANKSKIGMIHYYKDKLNNKIKNYEK